MTQVEHLRQEDLGEILDMLNESFSHQEDPAVPPHQADFKAILPVMWTGEHDYGSRHLGIRENGRIVSLLGVYPLPAVIAGEKVLLGTIGNVASLPSARGKGYMKQLMAAALEEADRQGFLAARLGGLRSRYNRHGFDHAGTVYFFRLTRRNVKEYPSLPALRFRPLSPEDHAALLFARQMHDRKLMRVLRETDLDFYSVLTAWKNEPFLAEDEDGRPAGYLSVSPDGGSIAEWGTAEGLSAADLAAAFLAGRPDLGQITFPVMPWELSDLRAAYGHCESWFSQPASMFHVFRWGAFTGPLMRLAARTSGLADGSLTLEIRGQEKLRLSVAQGVPAAEPYEGEAEISLDELGAVAWLFGGIPPLRPMANTRPEAGWFPLPLSWNGQDRV